MGASESEGGPGCLCLFVLFSFSSAHKECPRWAHPKRERENIRQRMISMFFIAIKVSSPPFVSLCLAVYRLEVQYCYCVHFCLRFSFLRPCTDIHNKKNRERGEREHRCCVGLCRFLHSCVLGLLLLSGSSFVLVKSSPSLCLVGDLFYF